MCSPIGEPTLGDGFRSVPTFLFNDFSPGSQSRQPSGGFLLVATYESGFCGFH